MSQPQEKTLGPITMKDPQTDRLIQIPTHTFLDYSDGFSFGVSSKLDAYRAAYEYRYSRKTVVTYTPHSGWRVSVYSEAKHGDR